MGLEERCCSINTAEGPITMSSDYCHHVECCADMSSYYLVKSGKLSAMCLTALWKCALIPWAPSTGWKMNRRWFPNFIFQSSKGWLMRVVRTGLLYRMISVSQCDSWRFFADLTSGFKELEKYKVGSFYVQYCILSEKNTLLMVIITSAVHVMLQPS